MPVDIGSRIREARQAMHLTQEELAKEVGTTKQNIYKYESGIITNIPLDKLEAIARLLRMDPAVLCGWNEPTIVSANLPADGLVLSDEEKLLVMAYRNATPGAQEIAMEVLANHPAEKQDAHHA